MGGIRDGQINVLQIDLTNFETSIQSGASYLSQGFPSELPGSARAVGSDSSSQSAGETSKNIIFKTLRQIGRPALYIKNGTNKW